MKSPLQWLLSRGAYAAALRIAAILISLAFVSAFSFWMKKDDYGLLAMILSVALFGAAIGGFGQRDLLILHASRALAEGASDQAQALASRATRWTLLAGAVAGLLAAATIWLRSGEWAAAAAAAAITLMLSLNEAWTGEGRARETLFWALAPREILWRAGALAIAAAGIGSWALMSLETGLLIVTATLALALASQRIGLGGLLKPMKGASPVQPQPAAREAASASISFSLAGLCGVAFATLDVVLVGLFIGAEAAAEYFPANRLALLVGFFALTMQVVIGPPISQAFKAEAFAQVQKLVSLAAGLAVAGAALSLLALWSLSSGFSRIFATASAQTVTAFLIIGVAYVVDAALGHGQILLAMSGQHQQLRRTMLAATGAGTLILIAFASTGSMVMTAVGVFIGMLVRKVWVVWSAYRSTGVAAPVIGLLFTSHSRSNIGQHHPPSGDRHTGNKP